MKSIYLFILVFIIGGCSHVVLTPDPQPQVEPTPAPISPTPTPSAVTPTVTFKCQVCDDKEAAMLPKMQKLLNEILHGQCLSNKIQSTSFRSKIVDTNLSRQQIVEKLISTSVKDIPLEFYYPGFFQSKSVVGYTIDGDPTIYLNRNFRNSNDWGICAEVSNEMHEVSHKMGFNHDYKATANRPYSVPYTLNAVVDACCDDKKGAL